MFCRCAWRARRPRWARNKAPRRIGNSPARRILVVEDNPVNRRVATRMLERMGCQVEHAENGAEAVARCQKKGYDLIFMDVHMPEMDGLEATSRIRKAEAEGRRTPIVAMTASAMREDREQCLEAGMDDYVAKPVQLDLLAAVLRRHVVA